jgi:glycosyltransferase involved in cell wall biosynthesis
LDRQGFEPSVACLYNASGSAGQALREQGIPVFEAGTRHKVDLASFGRLYRTIGELKPAILHTHLFHANLPGRLLGRLANVPVIINTEHTLVMESEWRYRLNRWSAPMADRVVAVSAAVRDFCIQHIGLPASKVVLIRNGIELPNELPEKQSARQYLGLPGDIPLLGAVGRLDPAKGYDILLQALPLVERACLVIAGEGPERTRLEALAQSLGVADRVRWLGFQAEILPVLAAFDLFVQPSRHEGLPVTVLEAMAAGLPVVATSIGGTPEAVLDGETGRLVPPEDPGALAAALNSLLGDPSRRQEMGTAGRARVGANFSLSEMVCQTEALYIALLREKGLPG